jgi:acyl-coenzyme A synthetase/AMP-(fatty) acid ligase
VSAPGGDFAAHVLGRFAPQERALVELTREGSRREWTFGEVAARVEGVAGLLAEHGVRRGDVVMTLIGNRPEWVVTMMACFRIGAVAWACTEQLRARDLGARMAVAGPALVVADERNRAELEAARPACEVLLIGEERAFRPGGGPATASARGSGARGSGARGSGARGSGARGSGGRGAEPTGRAGFAGRAPGLPEAEPALITFTSGTAGEPKAVLHGARYLWGQRLQAQRWLGARRGELVWCTASAGWSKSARNVFIAPWLCGAAALLHDARFDPAERCELLAREGVNVLCMAPTEYRVIAKRTTLPSLPALRGMVAAGEALDAPTLRGWRERTGLEIRDGYGQTETGQVTGMPIGEPAREGSMGRPLEGVRAAIEDGELVLAPETVPTFFLGYIGEGAARGEDGGWVVQDRRGAGRWRTGDRVHADDEGFLYFEGRTDDVIISAGYRIGPFEVESALVSHPAVAEAAAVAAPDEERGAVVRAVVVPRPGHAPSRELARELQEHVKRTTAPYKYPRIVEFAAELPKTPSGKVRRAALREQGTSGEQRMDPGGHAAHAGHGGPGGQRGPGGRDAPDAPGGGRATLADGPTARR